MHSIEWVFSGIGVLLLAWLASVAYKFFHPAPTATAAATPPPAPTISRSTSATSLLDESQKATLDYWVNATVRIRKGDYYSVGRSQRSVRVAVTDIRADAIPSKWGPKEKNEPGVELDITASGAVTYGGTRTIDTGVNKFILPQRAQDEGAESVYAFHSAGGLCSFLRICVNHINIHDACADVNVIQALIFWK